MICKLPNVFIIIRFDLTQLRYNLAYGGSSASVVWCTIVFSKAVLSHVALRHDDYTIVSYWFLFFLLDMMGQFSHCYCWSTLGCFAHVPVVVLLRGSVCFVLLLA
jgi:hypothetical protein